MALTKKQRGQLERKLQNYYRTISLSPNDNLKKEFKSALFELEDTLKILGYNSNQIIKLKNDVMEKYNLAVYIKYVELNELINEIQGHGMTFLYEYEPKEIYDLIKPYQNDIRYNSLMDTLYYIKQEIKKEFELIGIA